MMDMMNGGMGGMMVFLIIFWLIFGLVLLALAIAALVWLIRALRRQSQPDPARSNLSPQDELNRRYAYGELSREQYLQSKADLTHS
jgi:uncharacterized membrane protein